MTTYRRDIDGLRAFAVLLVVGYHAAPSHFPGGFIGVDVFFVISGYLITGVILRELEQGTFSFLQFYARRFRRIVPALAIVLAVVWAIGWGVLVAREYNELGKDVTAGATFTTNIVLWKEYGYFATAAQMKPLLHLWSLGVEEQFYLAWPLLLFFASRWKWPIAAIVSVLALASFGLNVASQAHHEFAAFYLLPTRLWELLVGALLVSLSQPPAEIPSSTHNVVAAGAILVLVAAALTPDADRLYWPVFALAPTIATTILIVVGERGWISRIVLSANGVVLVGLISYPLYLWHWPLLSLANVIAEDVSSRIVRGGLVCLAFVLAWLTWRLVEKPVRRTMPASASRSRALWFSASAVGALAFIACIGWTTHRLDGFPDRYARIEHERVELSQATFDGYKRSSLQCSGPLAQGNRLAYCATSKPGAPVAAILGDSHAEHLFPGIADGASENWLLLAHHTCPPIVDVRAYRQGTREECSDLNRLAVDLVAHSDRIKTVVLSSYYRNVFGPPVPGLAPLILTANANPRLNTQDAYAYGLSTEVARLEEAGRDVVLFVDVPAMDFAPASCIASRPFRLISHATKDPCAVSRDEIDRQQEDYRRVLAQVVEMHPRVRVFDPEPFFCDALWCYARRDGEFLYRDRHHLNLRGSRFVAEYFLTWLKKDAA